MLNQLSDENTINVPLNEIGMGDSEYIAFIQHFVVPIIHDFMPGLILVSCGFDAAFGIYCYYIIICSLSSTFNYSLMKDLLYYYY